MSAMSNPATQPLLQRAADHHRAGRLAEAQAAYRQVLAAEPNHADALHLLGVILGQAGRHQEAAELIRRAIAVAPGNHAYHFHLASFLQSAGRMDEAIASYQRAIELKPDFVKAHNDLGTAWKAKGEIGRALACYRRALALSPNFAGAYCNLGMALRANGQTEQAIACYERALAIDGKFPLAHYNLANAWKDTGKLDAAIAGYQRAIALDPHHAAAYSNLANALADNGQLDEAIAANRKAMALRPGFVAAHDNLLFTLHSYPASTAQSLLDESRRWNEEHARRFGRLIRPHTNIRNPDRRLRIGYVSADFCEHVCAQFLLPLLGHHDRRRVELICYAQVARADAVTRRFEDLAGDWRWTVGMSDEQVAQRIREDRIDILVDLKLHTDNNRLLVFAQKPAPVQVTWLGYPGTTGLDTMDYRLTDPYIDPPGLDDAFYCERSIRLGDTFWCYDPLTSEPAVSALPCLQDGHVTFGCLNNFRKVNNAVLSLWAMVLGAAAGSRLLLRAPEGSARQRVLDRLGRDGIGHERVQFVARQAIPDYFRTYHHIDIALDTTPYNGHTTSLDALWMGVPVVTLAGQTAVGRAGVSQLTNLGLPELIARAPEDYVRLAAQLAADRPRLVELRATLRERMRNSPLMDYARFARGIEDAYGTMWRTWCAS